MSRQKLGRHTQLCPYLTNFIFVKRGQRLEYSIGLDKRLNPRDAIVMGLDEVGFGGATRLDGIRINCPLAKNPLRIQEVARLQQTLLHLDELFADGEALGLRLMHAGEGRHEFRLGMLNFEMGGAQRGEYSTNELGLAFSHESGINVHTVHALWT